MNDNAKNYHPFPQMCLINQKKALWTENEL